MKLNTGAVITPRVITTSKSGSRAVAPTAITHANDESSEEVNFSEDDDINNCILSDEKSDWKKKMWEEHNKNWITDQEDKKIQKERDKKGWLLELWNKYLADYRLEVNGAKLKIKLKNLNTAGRHENMDMFPIDDGETYTIESFSNLCTSSWDSGPFKAWRKIIKDQNNGGRYNRNSGKM
eukprot:UN25354